MKSRLFIFIFLCIFFLNCSFYKSNIEKEVSATYIKADSIKDYNLYTIVNIIKHESIYLIEAKDSANTYKIVSSILFYPLPFICKEEIKVSGKYQLKLKAINEKNEESIPYDIELMYNFSHVPVRQGTIVYEALNLFGLCLSSRYDLNYNKE